MLKWNPLTGELDYSNNNVVSAKKLIITKIADEVISASKLVYFNTSTTCKLATNDGTIDEASVVGVALNAGGIGTVIRIQAIAIVEDATFTFNVNDYLFLGSSGSITNIDPNLDPLATHLVRIGYGLGNGSIMVSLEKPIIL